MKLFTQLTLVSAIAASGSAVAMQSMDDAALSETTGQDGITIVIAPPALSYVGGDGLTRTNGITIGAAVLHDKDGLKAAQVGTAQVGTPAVGTTPASTDYAPASADYTPAVAATSGGAIIIGDASQANTLNAVGTAMGIFGSGGIVVKIDATGGTGGTVPMLNIGLSLPSDLLIRTGDISIDGSNRDSATIATGATGATIGNAATGGTKGTAVKILDSMEIALGGAKMNIQLGNSQQTGGHNIGLGAKAMIVMSGKLTGGLNIADLGLKDGSSSLATLGGTLGVSQLTLTDAGGADLTLSAGINVVNDVGLAFGKPTSAGGLIITAGGSAMDIMMQNVTLGEANSTLGDLELINVNTVGTKIAIMGH